MQSLDFGQKMPSQGGNFIRVKNAGESVTFRIAQPPVYTGKHFLTTEDGKWNVVTCPRINENEECEHCKAYFDIMAQAKEAEAQGDKGASEELKKEARRGGRQVSIEFYFPVLNRDTGHFGILQTTFGVRNKINEKFENGVKIYERDFVLKNTGSKSPRDLYLLDVVDSADSKPLTEDEMLELQKAKDYDLSRISSGQQDAEIEVPDDFGEDPLKAEKEALA